MIGRKTLVYLLVVIIACTAGYKVKVEWVDPFKERQIAGLWLLLVQRGEFDRAGELVNEEACKDNGFKSFDVFQTFYEQGYFEGAKVSKMYFDKQGQPVATVILPENPKFEELHLWIEHDNDSFQINDISFISKERGIVNQALEKL